MAAQRIRVAVMGAGGVGGYFGAKLAASGLEVAFIARGKHLEAMRGSGLRIKSAGGDLHIHSLFTSDPEEIGPVDLILFCVKSYDTREACLKLAPMVGEKTLILSLQNGIDNPDRIAELWGQSKTLAGVVYIGARLLSPGAIEHSAGGRIIMGGLDSTASEGVGAVQELFTQAEVPFAVSTEIRKAMWGKLVWNAPFCALSCLARATVKEIMESKLLKDLAIECMEEVREAASCQGIDLSPAVVAEALTLSESLGDFKPSMLQDLEAGKPLEHEAFNGVVTQVLHRAGREAPVNRILYSLLCFLDCKLRALR